MEKINITCSYSNSLKNFCFNSIHELTIQNLRSEIAKTIKTNFMIICNNIEILEDDQLAIAVQSGKIIEIFNSEIEDSNLFDNAAIEESIIPNIKNKENKEKDPFWSDLNFLSKFLKEHHQLATYLNSLLQNQQNDLLNELALKAELKMNNEKSLIITAKPGDSFDLNLSISNKSFVSLINYDVEYKVSSNIIKINNLNSENKIKNEAIAPGQQNVFKYKLIVDEAETTSESKIFFELTNIPSLKCDNLEVTVLIEVDQLMKFIKSKTKNPKILELSRDKLQLLQEVLQNITPHLTLDEIFKAHNDAKWNSDQAVQILFQDN